MNATACSPTLDSKIYVAGHRSMIGAAILRALEARAYTDLLVRNEVQMDILDQRSVFEFIEFQRPAFVFCAAERTPASLALLESSGQLMFENLNIQTNLIHGAHEAAVQGLLFVASDAVYPASARPPLAEASLLSGPPAVERAAYAQAKVAGIVLVDAYRAQYGHAYFSVVPSCVYGPADKHELQGAGPVPTLMRLMHLAKRVMEGDLDAIRADEKRQGPIPEEILGQLGLARGEGKSFVATGVTPVPILPGSPEAAWDLLFADDLAARCVGLMEQGYAGSMVNVASGVAVRLDELAGLMAQVVGYSGAYAFAADGRLKGAAVLDTRRVNALLDGPRTPLLDGLAATYADYTADKKARKA